MYEIALINVFWGEDTQDTRFFNTLAEQTTYFEELAGGKWTSPLNFLIKDRIRTRVTYRDRSGRSIPELLGCNYCVVKNNGEYRYYFAKATHDSGDQMVLDLVLDDIQTNYFKYKHTIQPCEIQRACLNRFKINEDNTLSFNLGSGSDLYTDEGVNAPKYLHSRQELTFKNDYIPAEVKQWIDENIIAWRYVFLTNNDFEISRFDTGDNEIDKGDAIPTLSYGFIRDDNLLKTYDTKAYKVICVPVFKESTSDNARIELWITQNGTRTLLGLIDGDISEFTQTNNNTSFFLTQKLSKISPFDLAPRGRIVTNYQTLEIIDGVLVITYNTPFSDNGIIQPTKGIINEGVYVVKSGDTPPSTVEDIYETFFVIHTYPLEYMSTEEFAIPDFKETFEKEEIVNQPLNYKLNPKMFDTNFYELNITLPEGDAFTYDVLKYAETKGKCLYTEILQPETTKRYMRIDIDETNANCLYNTAMEKNFLGVTSSVNNNVPYANDQYSAFIANNKNFWAQSNFKILGGALSGAVSGAVGGAMSSYQSSTPTNNKLSPLQSAKFGLGGAIVGGVGGLGLGLIDRAYTIDNMRKAPQSVSNMSGDIFTNLSVNDYNLAVEIYKPVERDLIVANQYMHLYGFTLNEIGVPSDYDNIRSRFNFVQALFKVITAPISDEEKTRLRERFASGVRFWNSDTVDFLLENHENIIGDLNND